ncbi:MAG: hypothetical protein RBS07_09790 [Lentimicrobium sp.]|jgi:transcriptional regulator with XRE-family HTH domain|nr:hypothetical protein [Lentimicrobium sp.]
MSFNYNKIKELSTEKQVPFNALAEKIGVSRAGFYRTIENKTLSVAVLEKIAEVLEEPITAFFELDTVDSEEIKRLNIEIELRDSKIHELNNRIQEFRTSINFYRREIKYLLNSLLDYINENITEATSIAQNSEHFYRTLMNIIILTRNTGLIETDKTKVVEKIMDDFYKQKRKE